MGCTKTNKAVFNNELLDTVIEHSFDGIYITDGQATTIKETVPILPSPD